MSRNKPTDNSVSDKIILPVLLCFFLSGVTGLIYEVLWTRMIVKIIGGAPFAVSIILTVFMGGLGLGSYIAGRVIDDFKNPAKLLRTYGLLELAIGVYAFAIPMLLSAFKPLYVVLYNQLFTRFILYNFLTFLGCAVLLCVPVIFMGATLPILCRFYVTKLSHLGTHSGRLYGLNTLGAAAGALLCGFWLINILGVWGTLILAVFINITIGLFCVLTARSIAAKPIPLPAEQKNSPQKDDIKSAESAVQQTATSVALVIFAVSGFCAMSYEVIWTRLLGLIVGPTTYSFTVVLVTFILGLAVGSMFFGWLADKTGRPLQLLIFTQAAAALFALGVSQLFGNSQLFFAKLIFTFKDHFALLNASKALILFGFMIFPTFCLGATFPLVGKIYTQSISKIGRSIGFAYSINTIGAVLGSFCAGFILIPLLGKEKGLSLTIALQLFTVLFAVVFIYYNSRSSILRPAVPAITALAGLWLCFYFPHWDHRLLSKSKYHRFEEIKLNVNAVGWLKSLLDGPEVLNKHTIGKLMYYGEGAGGFTSVLEYTDPFGNINYTLANSGKADASTNDMSTQALLAHIPMLFHSDPKTVMVLGFASGITAGETLYYPIEKLDIVEINSQTIAASRFFVPWNNNVLADHRTNLIIQDGRAHLQLTRQKYDVIISEPSNPWMAGLAVLFTKDFFDTVKSKLNDNGIFTQWFHSYEMDWPTFALVGRSFAQVFPDSILILPDLGQSGDYLFIGFKNKSKPLLENIRQKLIYTNRSKNIIIPSAEVPYAFFLSEDLQKLFGDGVVNTDNHPLLEFAAPKLMYHYIDSTIPENIIAKRYFSPETTKITQHIATDVETQIDCAVYALSVYSPFKEMVDLAKTTPIQKQRFFDLMERYCAKNLIDYYVLQYNKELKNRCLSAQIKSIEDNIDRMPDKATSYLYLAQLYFRQDKTDETIANCIKSLAIEPDNAEARHFLGRALVRQNRFDEAALQFTESLRIDPYNGEGHHYLGTIFSRQGKYDEAITHFTKALEIKPDYAESHYNLGAIFASRGELQKAAAHFRKTLQSNPGFAAAHKNLADILSIQGNSDEAAVHLKEALRLDPNLADANDAVERISKNPKS
jgi:spermidine synthase